MAPQSPHDSFSNSPARRRRPTKSIWLRCEQFEDRITPAQFTAQTALSFPAGTMNNNGCVAAADFNKDGRMDAIVTNYGTNENNNDGTTVVQLMGRSTPGFNVRSYSTGAGQSNASFVTVADINGDTWPDLLVSNGNQQGIGSVSVFRNDANGAGTMTLVGTFPTGGNNATWVGTADFTGDGVLDVAVAHIGKVVTDANGDDNVIGNKITVFQGNGDSPGHGNFTFNGPIATLAPTVQGVVTIVPYGLALADFDGDHFVDIVAVSPGIPPEPGAAYPEGSIYLFKGNGSGGFAAPNQLGSGGTFPGNVQAADVDGDGMKDLVVANLGDVGQLNSLTFSWTGNSVAVLRNLSTPGSLQFDFADPLTANIRGPFATAVADFNLDGKADIAAINYGAPSTGFSNPKNAFVTVYMGSTTQPGQFDLASPPEYDTLTGNAGGQYLAVADFNGNTTPDLIVVHDNNKVDVLLNTSTSATAPKVASTTINGGSAQRSMVNSLAVTFSNVVSLPANAANGFTLTRNGGGSVTIGNASASTVGGVTVVTLTGFSGLETNAGSLNDGKYTLTALASQITANGVQLDGNGDGTGGDNYVLADNNQAQGLYRLFGDANGDRTVDNADFFALRGSFLLTSGQSGYLAYFDFNGDGTVDNADFFAFRSRFLTSI